MVKLFETPKIYYINGVLATMEDLNRLQIDYLTKKVEILEIKHNASFCWIKTNQKTHIKEESEDDEE